MHPNTPGAQLDPPGTPMLPEESESDILPFALDSEGMLGGDLGRISAGTGGYFSSGHPTGMSATAAGAAATAAATAAAAEQRDIVVGAFIALMHEAPPLMHESADEDAAAAAGGCEGGVHGAATVGGGGFERQGFGPVTVGDALLEVELLAAKLRPLVHAA